jgi:hypothetical protein
MRLVHQLDFRGSQICCRGRDVEVFELYRVLDDVAELCCADQDVVHGPSECFSIEAYPARRVPLGIAVDEQGALHRHGETCGEVDGVVGLPLLQPF